MSDRWMSGPDGWFIPDWWVLGPRYVLDEIELGWRVALWLEEENER